MGGGWNSLKTAWVYITASMSQHHVWVQLLEDDRHVVFALGSGYTFVNQNSLAGTAENQL